ncbi:MAG: AAA family ATPase, partial [Thermoguttaceae bacterium]|nr:AAA family ATPase [Thermoguttaceae bacterium]
INTELKSKILIDSLSAGVKIIIGLVGDIAFRCVKLNPHLGSDALTKTPGVVLIDEIELHLHPEWQQVILPTLRSVFPRIQFIVTTHSPQVITSVPKECVRILGDGHAENPFFQTQGVESQEALLSVFGVNPAPNSDEFVKALNEYERMTRSGEVDSDKGRLLYQSLREHFGEDYPPLERIEINHKYRKNSGVSEKGDA